MANLLSWGVELAQKAGVKIAGKSKMAWKTLGGKATKEVAEQIGKETGEKLAAIDAKQAARRETARAYKTSLNEARRPSSSKATEAINNPGNSPKIDSPVTSYDYRQRIVDGKEVFEKRPTGASDSAWASIDDVREYRDARRNSHSKTSEFTYTSHETTGNLPAVITAQETAQAQAAEGIWDGIPEWAKMTGAAVAGGIAAGVIFDDD